jgi:topoisomerase-4 subunit A
VLAQAIKEEELSPAEPITVVLSKSGWVRAAKGHEVDGKSLSYRAMDEFLMQAPGKSNQLAIFVDSMGKSYAVAAHTLPSARGQGEPLTSRLKPEEGANFVSVLMGDETQKIVLASDAGYGFITNLGNLITKNRNGKQLLKLPTNARVLPARFIQSVENQYVAVVTNEGRLLVFPIGDLPELPRGKGNKLIQIPSKKSENREEYCVDMIVVNAKSPLTLHAGKRHLTLKASDLANFHGERGNRGNKLPRGFLKVDFMTVEG